MCLYARHAKYLLTTAIHLLFQEKGGILDDETVQMKSYLLSLGVSDPVTRSSHGYGSGYFKELAKELNKVLNKPIEVSNYVLYIKSVSKTHEFTHYISNF